MRSVKMAQVEGHTTLKRDMSSHAVLNTDDIEYNAYRIRREQQLKQKKDLDEVKSEINELKTDLAEIKELLGALLKGK